MPARVAVFGATGLVGGAALAHLVHLGCATRAIVRSAERVAALPAAPDEVAVADLADPASLPEALDGIESAILVSPVAPDQVALQGNALDALVRARVRRLVKISGLATALDSPVRSGRWHAETEKRIRDSGLEATFLRAPFFQQNLRLHAASVRRHGVLSSSLDPAVRIAMVDGRDLGRVAASCVVSDDTVGEALWVSGPEALTYPELAERIGRVRNEPVRFQRVPPLTAVEQRQASGLPPWRVELLSEFDRAFEADLGSEVSDVVERLTDRRARSVDDYLNEHVELFRSERASD